MTCRGVILDLDGTLADTLRDITDAVNAVLAEMHLPGVAMESVREFVGEGLPTLCRRALGPEHLDKLDRMAAMVAEHYRLHDLDHTTLYDGVPEMLDELAARGIPLAVLSNKPQQATARMVAALCRRWRFVAVEGFRDEERRKPDPRVALEIVAKMHASPHEVWMLGDSQADIATAKAAVWMLGDSQADIATAKAADMVSVAATWGFRDRNVLEAQNPDHIIDRPADLFSLL
jgi:phosphoglycolate phosphatase